MILQTFLNQKLTRRNKCANSINNGRVASKYIGYDERKNRSYYGFLVFHRKVVITSVFSKRGKRIVVRSSNFFRFEEKGHNFVPYLVENAIRVVDKVLIVTAVLNPKQKEAFSQVEVWQKDLVDRVSIEKSFTRADGSSYFNLAAETKYSQIEKVYEVRVYTLSVRNAEEAARRNVKVFVEISTAEIYRADKNPSKEDDKAKPWTMCEKYKYRAEEKIKAIEGFNLVILRLTIVYGPGATMGLTPRIVCGRIYKLLDEEMKVLWSKDFKINTVHVLDVVRALWHVATWYQNNDKAGKGTSIYNLADLGNTDQERINKHLGNIFGIKTGFYGTITSNLAQLNLDIAVDDSNENTWILRRPKNEPRALYISLTVEIESRNPAIFQSLIYICLE